MKIFQHKVQPLCNQKDVKKKKKKMVDKKAAAE